MVAIVNHSLVSIHSLHYVLFTIRSYNTENETVLPMAPLVFENSSARKEEHFINVLNFGGWDPKEKERYSICIYYYRSNISIEQPDLFICQDVMNDYLMYARSKSHPEYRLLFILTQYLIILTILFVLQSLLSMRKHRIAYIVHQHLISKAHRFRNSFSSLSLVRQSVSSADILTSDELDSTDNDPRFSTRIVSSPVSSAIDTVSPNEDEPFIKLPANKNHVQFLLGEAEESDDTDEVDSTLPTNEPYCDRSDALQSVAHILDSDKPWCKYKRPSISPC